MSEGCAYQCVPLRESEECGCHGVQLLGGKQYDGWRPMTGGSLAGHRRAPVCQPSPVALPSISSCHVFSFFLYLLEQLSRKCSIFQTACSTAKFVLSNGMQLRLGHSVF